MTLQQELLKAEWKECIMDFCKGGKDTFDESLNINCNVCQGTGFQPQIFDNEICIFPNSLDCDCKEYKSGDVIIPELHNNRQLTKEGYCMDCGEFHKFKILKTLEQGKKIEMVRI